MSEGKRTIRVEHLARVEGEGALYVELDGDSVTEVRLEIFEPPRFFEGLLRGRKYTEAPDITARICGICPVAYQMGAAHAMEDVCRVRVPRGIRDLRHLLYCGEWIESHALHVFMLHLPDFLGFDDVVAMATDHSDIVRRGLQIKKTGNAIMRLLGGREIHPINPRVGGFYRAPTPEELRTLKDPIEEALEDLLDVHRFAAGLPYPDFEQPYEYVALQHPDEYAILEGRLVSNRGLDIDISQFDEEFYEEHLARSTALHGRRKHGTPYVVGPMARYNLNFERLAPQARHAAEAFGPGPTCFNPYRSLLVRLVEMIHACETALRLIGSYTEPEAPYVVVEPKAGTGFGCTEAPRGICWHSYAISNDGTIQSARIVPPTSQNQPAIEEDLRRFVGTNLHLPHEELQWRCEQCIRNYDPCISCSAHFLALHVNQA